MSVAIWYLRLLPTIRAAARACGWAVGLHGSMERDFDLIAVPWTEGAAAAPVLVEKVREAVCGYFNENAHKCGATGHALDDPTHKPHGRLAWSIQIGGGAYIDLSVMPREGPNHA